MRNDEESSQVTVQHSDNTGFNLIAIRGSLTAACDERFVLGGLDSNFVPVVVLWW